MKIYKDLLCRGGDLRLSEEDPYSTCPVQLQNGRFVRLHLSVNFKDGLFDHVVLAFTKCDKNGSALRPKPRGNRSGGGGSKPSRAGKPRYKGRDRGRGNSRARKHWGNRNGGGGAKPPARKRL